MRRAMSQSVGATATAGAAGAGSAMRVPLRLALPDGFALTVVVLSNRLTHLSRPGRPQPVRLVTSICSPSHSSADVAAPTRAHKARTGP
ncbi:hypothetical protein K505DRAFT_146505 [Melanomma pulvis-pyrius CBS 109.77]|uniref:Uncharacterized protein n=1 Tax=Melanomma pulvis-pyrius CBS 109.77 TaxID=1314802 RepID=A0A6A6WQP3_9PLEO|nr:hypothetical protein K505DRAFT_146505 [Melanomma pulvis-pyrius CBS 109.77]